MKNPLVMITYRVLWALLQSLRRKENGEISTRNLEEAP